jgi:hypothetical protein
MVGPTLCRAGPVLQTLKSLEDFRPEEWGWLPFEDA